MKQLKNIQPLLLITVVFVLQSCSTTNERHIGEWKGTDEGETASLILDKSNHAVLVQGNQVIGGKEFEMNGMKGECKYEIDYSKNPIWLDLVVYEQGKTQEKGRLKGIVRFITDNKIEYRLDFTGNRFDKFDPEDKKIQSFLIECQIKSMATEMTRPSPKPLIHKKLKRKSCLR